MDLLEFEESWCDDDDDDDPISFLWEKVIFLSESFDSVQYVETRRKVLDTMSTMTKNYLRLLKETRLAVLKILIF